MDRPTLFLDIDGVLNSTQQVVSRNRYGSTPWRPYRDECCKIALSNLEELVELVPDLQIVISSVWRLDRTVEELQELFRDWGFSKSEIIVGKTPVIYRPGESVPRGEEIQRYCRKHNIENYCIVDDDSDMLGCQKHRFVKTDHRNGFLWTDMLRVNDILKGRS